jgi:Flp pilus assembly protein TadG
MNMRILTAFRAGTGGNVAIMTALTLTIFIGATGGAIDFGRAYRARVHTQNIMDAAVLAAGRVLQTTQDEAAAIAAGNDYFNSMKLPSLLGSPPTFTVEGSKTVVRGVLAAHVDTYLLGVLDYQQLPINAQAHSILSGGSSSGSNYEISLMLDVTGSMCDDGIGPCSSGTKINALKDAATDLINIAVWDTQNTYRSRVAIVPFSTRVRVGPNGGGAPIMKRLTNLDPTWSGWYSYCADGTFTVSSETNGTWVCRRVDQAQVVNAPIMPCVSDRTGPDEFTDANPGPGRWLTGHDGTRRQLSQDSLDTPPTSGRGLTRSDPSDFWNYEPNGGCADVESANQVLPLTADKNVLRDKIRSLVAFGSTSGALGTAWSWYMLSPKWDDIWTGTNKPDSYSDLTIMENGNPRLKKVAILMSDGEYNTYRTQKEYDQTTVSNNAKTICTNMKAAGIEVYAVGFGLDQLPAGKRAVAEATLRDCGTDISHFYNALTVAQLQTAFRDIAIKLSVLRLKQ